MLVLLAEDDPKISKMLIYLLKKDGFTVDYASDGIESLLFLDMNDYDVIILDWMMPGFTGIEVCKKIREKNNSTGIIMLTAKDTLEDKIIGLESGADDYLVKPFEYRELQARIKALARRSTKPIISDIVTIGNFTIDRVSHSVFNIDKPLNLSNREFQLFSLLIENNGKVIPRGIIIERIWGLDGEVTNNNLDVFIGLLRKKLETGTNKKILINVRGIGYKLEV